MFNNNKYILGNKYYSNPENIEFSNVIIEDVNSGIFLDNAITTFKSVNDILLLIYANKNNSIISYDLIYNDKINETKKAHDNYISNIRHYFDSINKRDLILSISFKDNNLKIWDITFNCLVNLKNINQSGYLFSGTILNNNNQNYIITSNSNFKTCEPIKIFDFEGNKINEIENSNNITDVLDTYYDKIYLKNYIITGNIGFTISYDFNENKIYHKYFEEGDNYIHNSIAINNLNERIKLIETSSEGIVRIWDFHNGEFLNKIIKDNDMLLCVCLWNNNNIFVGCEDHTIKLINIDNGQTIKSLFGHTSVVSTIKKIIHPKYGECLVSYGGDIRLWNKNKNINNKD